MKMLWPCFLYLSSVPPQPYLVDIEKELEALGKYDAHVSLWLLEEGPGMEAVLRAARQEG